MQDLAGFRRYTWWAVPGTNVGVLILFTAQWILDRDVPAAPRALTAVALAVEVTAVLMLFNLRLKSPSSRAPSPDAPRSGLPHPGPPVAWTVVGIVATAVLAVCALSQRNYGLWSLSPAILTVVLATYTTPRARRRIILGATLLSAIPGTLVSLATNDGHLAYAALFPPGMTVFVSWSVLGPLWAWDIAGRLEEARRLSAELAIKDERLRFAADLHDIQGHHLQVIALKSELASRLTRSDPAAASAEMDEVRRLAIDALRDTRAVVSGYRRTSLDAEITNATRVLASAGIKASTTLDAEAVTEGTRHLLGLVMREAATNVLRHSRATTAVIEYRVADGTARLRVSNDGAYARTSSTGTGLNALAERLDAAGGVLAWTRADDRFEVAATLPAGQEHR